MCFCVTLMKNRHHIPVHQGSVSLELCKPYSSLNFITQTCISNTVYSQVSEFGCTWVTWGCLLVDVSNKCVTWKSILKSIGQENNLPKDLVRTF
jgi:hypothetical protein